MNGSSLNSNNSTSRNKLVVPGAQNAINQMKNEIASEFGVQLGPDATARQNGSVGGEITRRLVKLAQSNLGANGQQQ
jgi:small acid-soluble spore protein B (major beta-type SASP)